MNPINIIDRILDHQLKIRLLRALIVGGPEKTGRAWASVLNTSPPTVIHHLSALLQEGIVTRTTVGSSHTYNINHNNMVVRDLLIPLFQREKELIPSLAKALRTALDLSRIVTVVLYGSVALGSAQPNSDWDLLILCKSSADIATLQDQLDHILPKMRLELASTIDIKILPIGDFCERLQRDDQYAANVYRDYMKCSEWNPLLGQSLTEAIGHYGKKD